MQNQLPRTLSYLRRPLNYCGRGRTPGSHVYMDMAAGGLAYEMFVARVCRTGLHYSLAIIDENQALGKVRIDNVILNGAGPTRVDDVMIVGPLDYQLNGPMAKGVWRLTRPPIGRRTGVITKVEPPGNYGWLTCEQTGISVFVHQKQLRPGVYLAPGQRVSFVLGDTGRGPAAFDVGSA